MKGAPQLLIWGAVIAATISVGYAARDLPMHLSGESGLPPPEVRAGPVASSGVSIDSLLALSPFGRQVSDAPPETGGSEPSPDLTLRGVVIAAGAPSKAIIAAGSGPAQSYSAGDEVAPGTVLAEVLADHVVLETGGQRAILAFPDARPPRTTAALDLPPGDTSPPDLAGWHDRAREDPYATLETLGLTLGPEGYAVAENPSDELSRAGFLAGDRVTKVNGQQVGSIQSDLDLFDAALASGTASVDLIRDGQPLTLSFALR